MLLDVSNILLLGASFYCLFFIIKGFIVGRVNGYHFFLPVFLLFYAGPVLTDYLTEFGFNPTYVYIREALGDVKTSIIYNLYVAFLIVFFIWHSNKLSAKSARGYLGGDEQRERVVNTFLKYYNRYFSLYFIIFVIPIVLVFAIGDLDYYSSYSDRKTADNIDIEGHLLIARFILLVVVLVAFVITCILLDKKYRKRDRTLLIPFLFILLGILFWIHGKRSIVANYIVIQYTFFIICNAIHTRSIIRQLFVVLVGFVFFLIGYGKNIAAETYRTYWGLRLDFSRDYGLKFAIYNDLIMERHILPYDFATFIFNVFFFIPRTVWPAKPQPYAVYFTNSAFGQFGQGEIYGWGLTTSIFSEHISNIGWVGFITAPFFIYYIFQKESVSSNPFFKLLSILIAILLIVLQPISVMVLIILYMLLLVKGNKKYISR